MSQLPPRSDDAEGITLLLGASRKVGQRQIVQRLQVVFLGQLLTWQRGHAHWWQRTQYQRGRRDALSAMIAYLANVDKTL